MSTEALSSLLSELRSGLENKMAKIARCIEQRFRYFVQYPDMTANHKLGWLSTMSADWCKNSPRVPTFRGSMVKFDNNVLTYIKGTLTYVI